MKIITAPHHSLRQPAQPITKVDTKVINFIKDLQQTLLTKKNPSGVGLAAPQVDKPWQVFIINRAENETAAAQIQTFINPVITKYSPTQSFGEDEEQPVLEGCLSIPFIYGPVPRWNWIDIEYDELVDDQLHRTKQRLEWFLARVAQHELDHLHGILFTDYSLQYDLPIYRDAKKASRNESKLEEIDKALVELF